MIVISLRDAGRLARLRRRRVGRFHGRGRGADHRLPVRARTRDADGADGGDRSRRSARDPDQGPRGARADPAGRPRSCSTRPAPSPKGACRSPSSCPPLGSSEGELLRLAAAAEGASEHPIARAIADHGRTRFGALPEAESFRNRAGLGIEAVVDGHAVSWGASRSWPSGASPYRPTSSAHEPTPRRQVRRWSSSPGTVPSAGCCGRRPGQARK